MSFLDLDESLLGILEAVDLTVTPITDFKDYAFPEVALGVVEGAVANSEQLEIVKKLRGSCQILMAWGDCAVFGGINKLRDPIPVQDLLTRGYVTTESTVDGKVPTDPSLPVLLPRVKALNEVVQVEAFVPGCPPRPEAIAFALMEVVQGRIPVLPKELLHYD